MAGSGNLWRLVSRSAHGETPDKGLNPTETAPQQWSEAGRGGLCHVPRDARFGAGPPTHTVGVDEMTSLRVLAHNAPTMPMIAGKPVRLEADETWHGTIA